MGLDTYIYKSWEKEYNTFYDLKTKKRVSVPREGCEICHFKKNYVFLEWLEKRLGFEVEDCGYYVLYENDVSALLADCELALDLIEDAKHQFTDEVIEQIVKIFPQNKWNKTDFSHWDDEKDEPISVPHIIGENDYEKIKEIFYSLTGVIQEYVDKIIVYNSF